MFEVHCSAATRLRNMHPFPSQCYLIFLICLIVANHGKLLKTVALCMVCSCKNRLCERT